MSYIQDKDRNNERLKIVSDMLSNKTGRLLNVGGGQHVDHPFFKTYKEIIWLDSCVDVEALSKLGYIPIIADLDSDIDLTSQLKEYDVILFLEVLEHLLYPLDVLSEFSTCLKKDGEIIVSLPNEFHILRRLQVLGSNPDFAGYDWPHLHYFNRDSALSMFKDGGFFVKDIRSYSLIPQKSVLKVFEPIANKFDCMRLSYVYSITKR